MGLILVCKFGPDMKMVNKMDVILGFTSDSGLDFGFGLDMGVTISNPYPTRTYPLAYPTA